MARFDGSVPKTSRRARRGERGFSLIELMLAMCVFEVGALGLLALIYSSAQGVSSAKYVTQATNLATSALAELSSLPYDHANLAVGQHGAVAAIGGSDSLVDVAGNTATGVNFAQDDRIFNRLWTVATPVSGVAFKSIVVQVRWWDFNFKRVGSLEVRGGRSEQ